MSLFLYWATRAMKGYTPSSGAQVPYCKRTGWLRRLRISYQRTPATPGPGLHRLVGDQLHVAPGAHTETPRVILDTDDNPPLASALSWFVAIVVSLIAFAVQAVLVHRSPAAGDASASK